MRLSQLFAVGLSFVSLALAATVSPIGNDTEVAEPEVSVVATFPEENHFGHVVNGEKNRLSLAIENKSKKNVTLLTVAGSLSHPESGALLKNLTTQTYGIRLQGGAKLSIPYSFYSEFKPGDLRLNVWLVHAADETKYTVTAYDSIVTIVEPEASIFDFKLLITYLIVAGFFGGLVYFAYLTFVPQPKKTRAKKQSISAPTGTVTATGAGGYQEEWIPEHHLRKPKSARKESGVVSGTSGDELTGGDASGTESRRRKGKGRK
ncbi:hypothetical protein HGRIS_003603 [Hohenbuehelia grisea]|uniref:Translocon-associated protein subunit alpha n=1 Tax=Hohenbuehelia grisea TaxID=104357 RepID=A0ABR3JGF6_9AGAR